MQISATEIRIAQPSQAAISGSNLTFGSIRIDTLVHSRRKKAVRSQRDIVLAILEACRTPNVQHWIMVKARLGYETFWNHMNRLLSMGMMDELNEGNRTMYKVNAKGLDFLSYLASNEI